MSLDPLSATVLVAAGLFCGFINAVVSSGSAVSLPVLIYLGLPSTVANGTNRLTILAGALSSLVAFQRKGAIDWGRSLRLCIPCVAGSILGAWLASVLDARQVGGWAGFIGAHSAIAILLALMLGVGFGMVEANAAKALLLVAVGLSSIAVFGATAEVNWGYGVCMSVGSAVGGWAGGGLATHGRINTWMPRLLILTVVAELVQLLASAVAFSA